MRVVSAASGDSGALAERNAATWRCAARGAGTNQIGLLAQQLLQCLLVAAHDRLSGGFECRGVRARVLQRFQMRDERGPARESMRARQHELRIGEHAAAV
jgi:hypothetical protein